MANTSNFGVNLSTGKVCFPITLGQLSGPNGFGSAISLNYSTTGLVNQVTTWNEDSPTSIVGLGWSLQAASTIVRSGHGSWQDSFFLIMGDQTFPLLLVKSPLITKDFNKLHFVTQSKSLYDIIYNVSEETWTLIDQNGITCTYGGLNTDAVDLGIRWLSQDTKQPAVWIGASTEGGQSTYAIAWRLTRKVTPSGQQVIYTWSQMKQSVSKSSDTPSYFYTVANYLTRISVENGASVSFNYGDKRANEFPVFRWDADQPVTLDMGSSTMHGNAFQDRIETKYLESLSFYDLNETLQNTVTLTYGFLYENFATRPPQADQMDKRILVSITTLTAAGVPFAPPQNFDYWGLSDRQLQNKISNTSLLSLSNADISTNIEMPKSEGPQSGKTYGALFGHLKMAQSAQGGMVWYSYVDISQNLSFGDSWGLRYDGETDLEAPKDKSITWTCVQQPYWGDDEYVVIRWNGTKDKSNYICLQIYEWMGKWVRVAISNGQAASVDELVFPVYAFTDQKKPEDYYTRLATGSGKFILALANIAPANGAGNTYLFHRDANTPGQWNATSFTLKTLNPEKDQGNTFLTALKDEDGKEYDDDDTRGYYQLCLGVGNNIASLLDVLSGKLHLFSLLNNAWVYSVNQETGYVGITITNPVNVGWNTTSLNPASHFHFPTAISSLCVCGDDVLVVSTVNTLNERSSNPRYYMTSDVTYQLYHYDQTAEVGSNPWSTPIVPAEIKNACSEFEDEETYVAGVTCNQADGFIVVQIIIDYMPDTPGNTLAGCPVVTTWDDAYTNFYLQKIYSPNNAEKYNRGGTLSWAATLTQTPWPWQGNLSGNIANSNLINISTASTGSGSGPQKYVARYVGGKMCNDGGENTGWFCDSQLSNLEDDSDLWEKMATYDTTVGIVKGSGEDYGYTFYQLQMYGSNQWDSQDVQMGYNKDWVDIERILREVTFFVNLALQVVLTAVTFGESIVVSMAIRRALKCVSVAIRLSLFALNNPFVRLIESTVFQNALSNRRMGDGGGQNYLLVGTNKGSNGDENTGQPHAYYKSWDTQNRCWSWKTADSQGLLNNLYIPTIPFITSRPNQLPKGCLSEDVYRYGSSFIPFSYMSYVPEYQDNFARNFNADKVGFFRNGILSNLSEMGTFGLDLDMTYVNNVYPTNEINQLTYTFYQGENATFSPYAPWGGIIAYQPQVYTKYAKEGYDSSAYDLVAEGAAGYLWDDSGIYQELPSSASLSQSVSARLFLAQDQSVSGFLQDFAVNKVSVDDGVQILDTHIAYRSSNITYQSGLNSVVYNQVRVASGADSYALASQGNGWTEYYYYSGNPPQLDTPGEDLPFNPATDKSNPFYDKYLAATNAASNLNNLLGQCYATRIIRANPQYPGTSEGIEMVRQYNYSYAFNSMTGVGSQQVQYVVTSLMLTLTAADNAAQAYIQDSTYTVSAQYSFYDIPKLNGPVNLTGSETGRLLAQQNASYHFYNGAVEVQYQLNASLYGFEVPAYKSEFENLNFYGPTAQTVLSQTPDADLTALQPLSSSATVWTTAQNSKQQTYWYPYASYRWAGTIDGVIQQGIPWKQTGQQSLAPLTADWQLSSFVRKINNGIVCESVSVQGMSDTGSAQSIKGTRTVTLYDKAYRLSLASFSLPNVNAAGSEISSDMTRFCSFESYENLSGWSIDSTGKSIETTQETCYVGNRCLKILSKQGNTPLFYSWQSKADQKSAPADQIVISFFYAPGPSFTPGSTKLIVILKAQLSQGNEVELSRTQCPVQAKTAYAWEYRQVLFNLAQLAQKANLRDNYSLKILFQWSDDSPFGYLDAVSVMPLSATANFQVYDADTWLLKGTIDNNGLTIRSIYDARQRLIGVAKGCGIRQEITSSPATHYAREGISVDQEVLEIDFRQDGEPVFNASLITYPTNGGRYFDFRCASDLMGWQGTGLSIENNGLCIPGSGQATQRMETAQWGTGLRVQVYGSNGRPISDGAGIALGASTVTLRLMGTEMGMLRLKTPGTKTDLESDRFYIDDLEGDWMLIVLQNQICFLLNGKKILSWPTNTLDQIDPTVQLIAGVKDTVFRDIMFIQDPMMSIMFLDGTGKVRQTQSIAELGHQSLSPIRVNYSTPIKPPLYFGGLPIRTNDLAYKGALLAHIDGVTDYNLYAIDSLGAINLHLPELPVWLLNTMAEGDNFVSIRSGKEGEKIVATASLGFSDWVASYPSSPGVLIINTRFPQEDPDLLGNGNTPTMPLCKNKHDQVYYVGLNNETTQWTINCVDFNIGSPVTKVLYTLRIPNQGSGDPYAPLLVAILQTPLAVGGREDKEIVFIMSEYDASNNRTSCLYKYQEGMQEPLKKSFPTAQMAMVTPAISTTGHVYVTTSMNAPTNFHQLYCLSPDFKSVSVVNLPAESVGAPVISGNTIFLSLKDGRIINYDSSLTLLKIFPVATSLYSAPIISNHGKIYVVGSGNDQKLQVYILNGQGVLIDTVSRASPYQPEAMLFDTFPFAGSTCLSIMPGRYPNAGNNDEYDNMLCAVLYNGMNFDYSQDYTIELWVRFDKPGNVGQNYCSILEKYNDNKTGAYPFSIRYWPNGDSNGQHKGQIWVSKNHAGSATPVSLYSGDMTIRQGVFYHIAVTSHWDALKRAQLSLYINGICVDTIFDSSEATTQNGSDITLGGVKNKDLKWFAAQPFWGAMMELRIWNYARTPEQLQADKNRRLGREPGLLGYWPLTPDTCMSYGEESTSTWIYQAKDLISGCDAGTAALRAYFSGWAPSYVPFSQLQIAVDSDAEKDELITWDGQNLTHITILASAN